MKQISKHQAGFTLVEIAIVLVIIGLIIGAVLKGQELINNAKLKRAYNQQREVAAAAYTYFDRYGLYPGDDNTAGRSRYAYSIRFLGNDFGIPACTASSEQYWKTNESGNWAWCVNNYNIWSSANHRLNLSFLGSRWILSSMTPPSEDLDNSDGAINGGAIKLAREERYGILFGGEHIEGGGIDFLHGQVLIQYAFHARLVTL